MARKTEKSKKKSKKKKTFKNDVLCIFEPEVLKLKSSEFN